MFICQYITIYSHSLGFIKPQHAQIEKGINWCPYLMSSTGYKIHKNVVVQCIGYRSAIIIMKSFDILMETQNLCMRIGKLPRESKPLFLPRRKHRYHQKNTSTLPHTWYMVSMTPTVNYLNPNSFKFIFISSDVVRITQPHYKLSR